MNEQGIKITPSGCPGGDSIPITSDKCGLVENRSPEMYQSLNKDTGLPVTLPKVGGDINIVLPIIFVIVALTIRYFIKKRLTSTI